MTGTYRKAHRTSEARRQLKAELAVREALVRQRAKYIRLIGALVRQHGLRVGTGGAEEFLARFEKAGVAEQIKSTVALLVAVLKVNEQIRLSDAKLEKLAKEDEQVQRLCTVPSLGPVTAAAFVAAIDDTKRFTGPHQVQAYLGLVPSEMSSGEKQRKGRITKMGNPRVRSLLVQVAQSTMRLRKASTSTLWEWPGRIEVRRGKNVAAVALARKVAGIFYAMMRDATIFKPCGRKEEARAKAA
jgi:transposase